MSHIHVGTWRDDSTGPMQVFSGSIGREKNHFEAPPANCLAEMVPGNFTKSCRTSTWHFGSSAGQGEVLATGRNDPHECAPDQGAESAAGRICREADNE